MAWISPSERLPAPFVRVWVKTSTGRKTTAYIKPGGEWFLFCRKIDADNPKITEWEDV